MMKTTKIFCLISCFFIVGCSWLIPNPSPEQVRKKEEMMRAREQEYRINTLKKINIDDGVDYKEAQILAGLYFSDYISGCGCPGKIIDAGDHWEVELFFGYAAEKMKNNLIIDKASGKMTLTNYPTINDPLKEFLNYRRAPIFSGPLTDGENK
ncbi:MAG: hypothetical protein HQL26_11110 [Candidatus Omnitrophica bacterium]|nr:hypothetical protein [Candidatus Omnitrophota bacterium]